MILSLLMRMPSAHGYLLAKIINDTIGPYAKLSNGRLYPLLSKLQETGLINFADHEEECIQNGGRSVYSYKITEAGSKRFHQLMMDMASNPGEYQKIFFIKASGLNLVKPHERLRLLNHYLNYCQTHVLHLTSEVEDLMVLISNGEIPTKDNGMDAMRHRIDQWQLELNWATQLRERELAEQQAQIV